MPKPQRAGLTISAFMNSLRKISGAMLLTSLCCGCSHTYVYPPKAELKRISRETKNLQALLPETARKYAAGLQYIPGGKVTTGRAEWITPGREDTTLLIDNFQRMDTVADLYMSDHEVTNAEYMEFVNWVKDSIALALLAQHDPTRYADRDKKILNWELRKELWKYNDTMQARILEPMYYPENERFRRSKSADPRKVIYSYSRGDSILSVSPHPDGSMLSEGMDRFSYGGHSFDEYSREDRYKDRPVVGVSWEQANAYCHWKSAQYNKLLYESSKGKTTKIPYAVFRLPTAAEWEYAAKALMPDPQYERLHYNKRYPWWGNELKDENGKYRANFGMIRDQNNLDLKQHDDDGAYSIAGEQKTKELYKPNDFKLYNMAGNVAEWTADAPNPSPASGYALERLFREYYNNTTFKIDINKKEIHMDWTLTVFSDSGKSEVAATKSRKDEQTWKKAWIDPEVRKLLLADQTFINEHADYYRDSFYAVYGPRIDSAKKATLIDHTDDIVSALSKLKTRAHFYYNLADEVMPADIQGKKPINPFSTDTLAGEIEYYAKEELHTAMVYHKNPRPRIVKGGSWADGPAYLVCSNNEILSEKKCSSRVGFRVVMMRIKNEIMKE
jgi:sulfatase modifying factor 1